MINKDAISDFYLSFDYGATGFYLITASPYMQRKLADSFITEDVAIYDYAGKEDKFLPQELFHFINNNKEKNILFILNFQIPFLGKQPDTQQPDYFTLNLYRDALSSYKKKIFFFTTKEIEYNISIAAMDFFDYCTPKIVFEDDKNEEVKPQEAELEYRLNRYKDKIDEYLRVDMNKHCNNYLLLAARELSYFAELYHKISDFDKALELNNKALAIYEKILGREHLKTANSYNNTGTVYASQSNYLQAMDFFRKALTIREKVLGSNHPDTVATYNHIEYINRYFL